MKELTYYTVDGELGWRQDRFRDPWMHVGGCAAVTCCDSCILMARDHGWRGLYPFDPEVITKANYLAFAKIMKPYLKPRMQGIDRLSIYLDGFRAYAKDRGVYAVHAKGLCGDAPWQEAAHLVEKQVSNNLVTPCLLLHHKNEAFKDFQWHWFNLAGFKEEKGRFLVKAVTYGQAHWLDLQDLWETGHEKKGGLIAFQP